MNLINTALASIFALASVESVAVIVPPALPEGAALKDFLQFCLEHNPAPLDPLPENPTIEQIINHIAQLQQQIPWVTSHEITFKSPKFVNNFANEFAITAQNITNLPEDIKAYPCYVDDDNLNSVIICYQIGAEGQEEPQEEIVEGNKWPMRVYLTFDMEENADNNKKANKIDQNDLDQNNNPLGGCAA